MKSIKEYYTDRTASIKVGGCITDTFPTKAGVIQGEPPSPELFKIFIYELSDHLDEAYNDVPYLNGRKVSHLLWADDLFINALTSEGLQKLLDTLHEFCIDWGLTPNPIKCNVIIFNKAYIRDPSDQKFILGTSEIEIATSYTYLGLELTDSASLKHAMEIISRKGRRAMGALMSALDRKIVSPPIAIKLFKSLVQPILLYGAQLYCPLVAAKEILGLDTPCLSSYFNNHSSFGPEATHLRFVKWSTQENYERVLLVRSRRIPVNVRCPAPSPVILSTGRVSVRKYFSRSCLRRTKGTRTQMVHNYEQAGKQKQGP